MDAGVGFNHFVFGWLSTPIQPGWVARSTPPMYEGDLFLSKTPIAFLPGTGRDPTGIRHLLSPNGKQLAIALQKTSVTLFTSVTYPQVRSGDEVASQNRSFKILLHLRPSRPRLCRSSSEVPQHYESLCWVELETLVGIY